MSLRRLAMTSSRLRGRKFDRNLFKFEKTNKFQRKAVPEKKEVRESAFREPAVMLPNTKKLSLPNKVSI